MIWWTLDLARADDRETCTERIRPHRPGVSGIRRQAQVRLTVRRVLPGFVFE